ncbi:MAG TPA: hypothetical protein VFK20_15125, partial [Vicinamibacterales bacterium]|nr:hypothetical protein [Vicinamibacterales bacterium]
MRLAAALLSLALAAPLYAQTQPLHIVSAAPSGEIADLAEANEIRIVFSESMIALGRVPPQAKPAFVRITPAVAGTWR